MRDLQVLVELARAGAHRAPYQLTTQELARRLGVSQPTVARKLASLERRGLIVRELGSRGQKVQLVQAGLATLHSLHMELDAILTGAPRTLEFVGRVTSGVGEGSYYVRQESYRQQFKQVLGFDPHPGTLDLKLDKTSIEPRATLAGLSGKQIEGFSTAERTFGPVKCFPATLRGTKVTVILPSRSHYSDVIELIAPKNLRKSLKLTNGDVVKVEVMI